MVLLRNPVLGRELGLINRNWKVPFMVAGAAGISGGVVLLYLASAAVGVPAGGLPTRAGVQLFSVLMTLHLTMIILIAPGLTAGALSGERERRTLEPLLHTGLPALALVAGKLLAAVGYLLLLLVATLPSTGALFLLGGVGLGQLGLAYAVLGATALLLTTLGLAVSAFSRRTQAAATVAYILTALLIAGTALPTWLAGDALATWGATPRAFLIPASANPVAALAATTGGPFFTPVLKAALGPAAPVAKVSAGAQPSGTPAAAGTLPPAYASVAGLGAGGTVFAAPVPRVARGYLLFTAAAFVLMVGASTLAVRPPMGRGLLRKLGLRRRVRPDGDAAVEGGDAGD